MSTCIIHVGMHKTGTTSIQQSLNGYSDDEFYYEGAKELLNIIMGNSKTKIKESNIGMENSLPQEIKSDEVWENLAFSNNFIKKFDIDTFYKKNTLWHFSKKSTFH